MATRISLPNDRAGFSRLRALAEGFAAGEGLSETMGHRLVLILAGLFTNVHKSGRGRQPAESVEVSLSRAGEEIVITFADDGGAFDPLKLPGPTIDRTLEERPVGGLGVHIVRSMAQQLRYERTDGWNRLHLTCAIRP